MASTPSLAIKLFGTEEPVEPMRTLKAGPLTAEFDQGALRFIKINGVEAIRNIAFVVRDKDWGTYNPAINNLKIDQAADSFSVSYDAVCKEAQQELHYAAKIIGNSDGSLRFEGTGKAITDFLTNRTGFVVLHPVDGISGYPAEVEHVDGQVVQSEFPELVDPVQPFMDIRALTHEVLPGVKVTCRMEGDTFEMEDHRQWNDASYKTYVRPIAIPYPFTMDAGEVTEQSVTLTIDGQVPVASAGGDAKAIDVSVGAASGTMPRIGLGLEPQHAESALQHIDTLNQIAPQVIVCWHDLSAGHDGESFKNARSLGEALGAELVLEAVIPCADYRAEIAQIAQHAQQAGIQFAAVTVSPADYLKSITPGMAWPDVPDLVDIYDEMRAFFPGTLVGGGMHAFFPELNRKRPPTDRIDYITHTSTTITHASDDITVTENLEAIPFVIKTCRSFADGKPYRVGPSAIAARFNPYGSKVTDNPDNGRYALARMDPRQRGLINAAWSLGYMAHMARGGIEVVSLQAPTGEFGLIYHNMPWPQPWFDQANAQVYPAFHVLAGMAAAAGATQLETSSSYSHDVECIAYQQDGSITLWLTNLTGEERRVNVKGLPAGDATLCTLDADTFEQCVMQTDGFASTAQTAHANTLTLAPYAVVKLTV